MQKEYKQLRDKLEASFSRLNLENESVRTGINRNDIDMKKVIEDIAKHIRKDIAQVTQLDGQLAGVSDKLSKDQEFCVKIVQVIHVLNSMSVQQAIDVSPYVDAILLDSGNPNLPTKELGGTGRIHNWDLSKTIRMKVDVPIILAGGINSNNVKQAIDHVKPFGVDLCSSVRTHGKLDENKLKLFFQSII